MLQTPCFFPKLFPVIGIGQLRFQFTTYDNSYRANCLTRPFHVLVQSITIRPTSIVKVLSSCASPSALFSTNMLVSLTSNSISNVQCQVACKVFNCKCVYAIRACQPNHRDHTVVFDLLYLSL